MLYVKLDAMIIITKVNNYYLLALFRSISSRIILRRRI